MKTYSFEVNDISAFWKLSNYLYSTKIDKSIPVVIRMEAKGLREFNSKVATILGYPSAYCSFIQSCRRGVNGFATADTYTYDTSMLNKDTARRMGELLSENTKLNISFERIPHKYEFDLSDIGDGTIKDVAQKLQRFFLQNSVATGDSVKLIIKENIMHRVLQSAYYLMIGEALKITGDVFGDPSLSINLDDNGFDKDDIEESGLAHRLSQSGVNFSFSKI